MSFKATLYCILYSLGIVHLKHPGELCGGVGVVDGRHHEVGGGPGQDQDGVLDTVGQSQAENIARLHSQAGETRGQAGDLVNTVFTKYIHSPVTNPLIP